MTDELNDPVAGPVGGEPPMPKTPWTSRILIALGILILVVLMILVAKMGAHSPSTAKPPAYSSATCIPAAGEECASDQWFADWSRLVALNAEIAQDQQSPAIRTLQDKIDTSLGLSDRLRQQIPSGYGWDATKKKFVKMPNAPPTPTQSLMPPTK